MNCENSVSFLEKSWKLNSLFLFFFFLNLVWHYNQSFWYLIRVILIAVYILVIYTTKCWYFLQQLRHVESLCSHVVRSIIFQHHQAICNANQSTGFYMKGILAGYGLLSILLSILGECFENKNPSSHDKIILRLANIR